MKTGQTKLRGKKPRTEKVWQSQSLKKSESENTSIPLLPEGIFYMYSLSPLVRIHCNACALPPECGF